MPIQYRTSKPYTLQSNILNELVRVGYISRPMIKERALSRNYADIHGSIKSLMKRGMIKEYSNKPKKEKKPGIQEKFFILTDEGVENVIDENLSIEDFWKLVFFYFDRKNKTEIKLSFETILKDYINKLEINKNLILYDWCDNSVSQIKKFKENLDELDGSWESPINLTKKFLDEHGSLFPKIWRHMNYLSRFFTNQSNSEPDELGWTPEMTLCNRFQIHLSEFEPWDYENYNLNIEDISYQTNNILHALVTLEEKNSDKYYKLFDVGLNYLRKYYENKKQNNIQEIQRVFAKEFHIIIETKKDRPNDKIVKHVEKLFADYFSFFFYAVLFTEKKELEWNKYFERTKLKEWFNSWKNLAAESKREEVDNFEKLLTV